MARNGLEAPVTLSVLDRLVDDEPKNSAEPPLTRSQSLRRLREAIKRDLEWLLNTRRNAEIEEGVYKEVDRSVMGYGLPDITTIGLHSVRDQTRLRRALEQTILKFEPRIAGARVQMESISGVTRGIRFHIQGLLLVDPAPEPITFDTVLELPAGQYEVKGS